MQKYGTNMVPHKCVALPGDHTRTKAGLANIAGEGSTLKDGVLASDLHRTKLGPRNKGYRVNVGP